MVQQDFTDKFENNDLTAGHEWSSDGDHFCVGHLESFKERFLVIGELANNGEGARVV